MAAGYNGNLPFTVPRIQIPNTYNTCNLPATGKNSPLQLRYRQVSFL